jgi:ferredoxin
MVKASLAGRRKLFSVAADEAISSAALKAEVNLSHSCRRGTCGTYRCNLTTIDQSTAKFGEEPLKTLMSYRVDPKNYSVKFGAYFVVESAQPSLLHVGDELQVGRSF